MRKIIQTDILHHKKVFIRCVIPHVISPVVLARQFIIKEVGIQTPPDTEDGS